MKTQPLGSDYLLPVCVARAALVVLAAVIVGCLFGMVSLVIAIPQSLSERARHWSGVLAMGFWAGVCLVAIQRTRRLIRRQREAGFQGRIRKFRALRKREWNAVVEELLADPSVSFVGADGVRLTNPHAGAGIQSVITEEDGDLIIKARDGDLLAEIGEENGRVGTIDLHLIIDGC